MKMVVRIIIIPQMERPREVGNRLKFIAVPEPGSGLSCLAPPFSAAGGEGVLLGSEVQRANRVGEQGAKCRAFTAGGPSQSKASTGSLI